jgi:hypothetical protein
MVRRVLPDRRGHPDHRDLQGFQEAAAVFQ